VALLGNFDRRILLKEKASSSTDTSWSLHEIDESGKIGEGYTPDTADQSFSVHEFSLIESTSVSAIDDESSGQISQESYIRAKLRPECDATEPIELRSYSIFGQSCHIENFQLFIYRKKSASNQETRRINIYGSGNTITFYMFVDQITFDYYKSYICDRLIERADFRVLARGFYLDCDDFSRPQAIKVLARNSLIENENANQCENSPVESRIFPSVLDEFQEAVIEIRIKHVIENKSIAYG
jgi:hypothetical protein